MIERGVLVTFRGKGRSWLIELNWCCKRRCDGNLKRLWIKWGNQSWGDLTWGQRRGNRKSSGGNWHEGLHMKVAFWNHWRYYWLNSRKEGIDRLSWAKQKEMDHVGQTI